MRLESIPDLEPAPLESRIHPLSYHCFVINLDQSPDRLAQVAARLAIASLRWTRVPALEGEAELDNPRSLNRRAYVARHGKAVSSNELGCYLSHVKALTTFLESEHEFGVILEDDARFDDDIGDVLDSLVTCRHLWDVVQLSGRHHGAPVAQLRLTRRCNLVAHMFQRTCAAGYIVNRKAARRYVAGLLPMAVPFDHEFDRAWVYGIKFRGVRPQCVHGQSHDDTLDSQCSVILNVGRKKVWWKRGSVLLYRAVNEVARVFHYASRGLFIPRV